MKLIPRRKEDGGLSILRREMDDLFHRFFDDWTIPSLWGEGTELAHPPLEIEDRDDALHVKLEIPGMVEKDIQIEVLSNHLVISGEKKDDTNTTRGNVYRREIRYGSFRRAIPLPEGTRIDDAKAHYENGVLTIDVPKEVPQPAKKIEIH